MADDIECKRSVRPLYNWEIVEARWVFGDNFKYEKVKIRECYKFPDTIDRIGKWLKGIKSPPAHNAITIGNSCIFPVKLLEDPVDPEHPEFSKISWLMHELTHAWQFQHIGWRYLFKALYVQFKLKGKAYDFGQGEGLRQRRQEGWDFLKFNMEQQGDICRTYFSRVRKGLDTSDWQPFIDDLRQTQMRGIRAWQQDKG